MTLNPLTIAGIIIVLVTLAYPDNPGWADRGGRQMVRQGDTHDSKGGQVFDKRHNHNRQYPRPGQVFNALPRGSRVFPYRRHNYYFNDGIWYLPARTGFSVTIPPFGLTVPVLPPFYTTIWVGGTPYYYANDVYYVWRPEERVYVVSEPPAENEVVEKTSIPEQIFIYPKQGQSDEQQATDRYECHKWSVGQTTFDPSKPGGNVPEEEYTKKRLEYQRAMKACLEARNYSVQ